MDMKRRSIDAVRLLEICPRIDSCLTEKFDDMLWLLMKNAADKTHLSLEPWYSSLDPALAGFHPVEDDQEGDLFEYASDGSYVKAPSKSELREQKMKEDSIWNKLFSVFSATSSIDDKKAKGENMYLILLAMTYQILIADFLPELLRERGRQLAEEKKGFLPENRSSMINDEETEKIILSAFQYVVALQEHLQTYLNFQINHYLYNQFKDDIATFPRVVSNGDWNEMIPADDLDDSIHELKSKISEIKGSLSDVQKMQTQF